MFQIDLINGNKSRDDRLRRLIRDTQPSLPNEISNIFIHPNLPLLCVVQCCFRGRFILHVAVIIQIEFNYGSTSYRPLPSHLNNIDIVCTRYPPLPSRRLISTVVDVFGNNGKKAADIKLRPKISSQGSATRTKVAATTTTSSVAGTDDAVNQQLKTTLGHYNNQQTRDVVYWVSHSGYVWFVWTYIRSFTRTHTYLLWIGL